MSQFLRVGGGSQKCDESVTLCDRGERGSKILEKSVT